MEATAERLRMAVEDASFNWRGRSLGITMSLGVANSHDLADFESLISLADQALFDAKAQGRNCVVVRG